MYHLFFTDNNAFYFGGFQHLVSLLFYTVFGFTLIYISKNYLSKRYQNFIGNFLAISLFSTVILWSLLKIYLNDFDIQKDLPLNFCNLMALLSPLLTFTRKKIYYEVFFFWVFAGTFQSLITPTLEHGFPHYDFLKYWWVHAGLVTLMLYATFVYGFRPTFKSVFKSILVLQGYVLLMVLVNYLLDSNYFFLNEKPKVATLLDWFGEWPYYLIVAELILLPLFSIFYLPFYFTRKRSYV